MDQETLLAYIATEKERIEKGELKPDTIEPKFAAIKDSEAEPEEDEPLGQEEIEEEDEEKGLKPSEPLQPTIIFVSKDTHTEPTREKEDIVAPWPILTTTVHADFVVRCQNLEDYCYHIDYEHALNPRSKALYEQRARGFSRSRLRLQ